MLKPVAEIQCGFEGCCVFKNLSPLFGLEWDSITIAQLFLFDF